MNLLKPAQARFFSSQLFFQLCNYLKYKDLSLLMVVSKSFNLLINEYLYHIMKKLKLFNEDMLSIFDLQGNLLGHKAENKCNLIYKHFFYQEFKVTIMNGKEFDPTVTLKSNKVCHKGIKQLIVGHKFAGFLTFDNILYYAKTPEFIEDKINTLIEKKHVKSFTVCRNLVYLTEFGQIFIVYYQKNLNTLENEEDLIIFTLTTPIDRFFASYNFIVLLTNNDINNDKNYNKNENTNIYIFDLLSFDLKKINEPNRLRKLETPLPTIISCTVGSNICYFLTNNNILYFCDLKSIVFDRQTKEKPQIQTFDYFKNKRIIKIFSSFLSYFVIQQDNIPSIDQWDNQTVLHWASDIGFPDCVKLLKFHKITGLDLTLLDRKFLNDTLGIKSEEIQNRFLREIDLKRVITYKPLVLYAWGSNNYGQLGSSQYNNVSKPMKIMLPNIEEFDEIEKVEIGWRMTAILTKKKKLWITESTNKSKQPLLIENPHENMGEKNSRRKDSDKKKEKEDKKFLVFNGTSSSKSHKWIDITHFYSKIGKIDNQNISDVTISKETFVVVLSSDYNDEALKLNSRKNSCKSGDFLKKNNKRVVQKMKSASFIIEQLRWNQNLQKNQWKLGIEIGNDVFEIDFSEFDEDEGYYGAEDLKIRYFKKEGEIIWDKHCKIDNF